MKVPEPTFFYRTDGMQQFFCGCGKSYTSKSALKLHERMYCGKVSKSCRCSTCPYTTHWPGNLKRHELLKHSGLNQLRFRTNVVIDQLEKYTRSALEWRNLRHYPEPKSAARSNIVPNSDSTIELRRLKISANEPKMSGSDSMSSLSSFPVMEQLEKNTRSVRDWKNLMNYPESKSAATSDIVRKPGSTKNRERSSESKISRSDSQSSLSSHSGMPRFYCECGKSYKYARGLGQHKKYECGKEPHVECSMCPYRTKFAHNMKSHMALKHNRLLKSQKSHSNNTEIDRSTTSNRHRQF